MDIKELPQVQEERDDCWKYVALFKKETKMASLNMMKSCIPKIKFECKGV